MAASQASSSKAAAAQMIQEGEAQYEESKEMPISENVEVCAA